MLVEFMKLKFFNLCCPIVAALIIGCSPTKNENSFDQIFEVRAASLEKVRILDGPFQNALNLNKQSLLAYEPDRLLANFRKAAGLEPKADHYEGWEAETISGHSLGHYLSGCALMYASTGDERFKERVTYIVNELKVCQEADGDGFIGAFPDGKRILEDEVAKGNIRSQGFDLNGIWVPWYNEHKTLSGLRDAYHYCGNTEALEVAKKLANWIATIVNPLTHDQIQTMLACEFGGIHESLADLYADTGDTTFLALTKKFHDDDIIDPLAHGEDILPGKHGNTQIPKLIASARLYELTGDENEKQAAEFFWSTVVNHHSYVTGGHGNHEYFGPEDQLTNRLSDETTETCNVYNMLKLSGHLFEWQPQADIADYYERALFNHILSSQHPETGRVIYNLSLEMGGKKAYEDPLWFTCCVGTGMETHSKYGQHLYFLGDQSLYVSQYVASELNWEEMGVVVKQITTYPEEQGTTLELSMDSPTVFTLNLRYPKWAENGMKLMINEELQEVKGEPGSFVSVNRTWEDGDRVEVKLPFTLRMEQMPDDSSRVALFYGPVVLAGDIGPDTLEMSYEPGNVPVLLAQTRNPSDWLTPLNEPNTFKTSEVGYPRDVLLKPFYKTHDRRYTVYFDLFNDEEWKAYQSEYEQKQIEKQQLEALTYDFFQPGEMQPERDHSFSGDSIYVIDFRNRKGRVANRGGWFGMEMKVKPKVAMDLTVEYWGGFTGSKTFDIVVDDQVIATENISGKADGQFIQVTYSIPEGLTQDKEKVQVNFKPHIGNRAGPIFGVRTVERKK